MNTWIIKSHQHEYIHRTKKLNPNDTHTNTQIIKWPWTLNDPPWTYYTKNDQLQTQTNFKPSTNLLGPITPKMTSSKLTQTYPSMPNTISQHPPNFGTDFRFQATLIWHIWHQDEYIHRKMTPTWVHKSYQTAKSKWHPHEYTNHKMTPTWIHES